MINKIPLYAYKPTSDQDTLYLHQAMNTKKWPQFCKAMQKEIDDRMKDKTFSIVHKTKVPRTATVLIRQY